MQKRSVEWLPLTTLTLRPAETVRLELFCA